MDHMAMAPMSFFWHIKFTLLFPGWVPDTPLLYALTLIFAVVFAIAHEWIAAKRSTILAPSPSPNAYSAPDLEKGASSDEDPARNPPKSIVAIVLAVVIHGAYVITSYLLMMMVMTFNAGIFIAVMVGLCIGFLFFKLLPNRPRISSTAPGSSV